jgi:hypothetical protein
MPLVNGFVNVSPAYRLIPDPSQHLSETTLLLSRVPVVVLKDVGICLEKEPHVRVSDPLADHLRAQPGFHPLFRWVSAP